MKSFISTQTILRCVRLSFLTELLLLLDFTAHAYPEFQQHIVKSTQRAVNCAMCHAHPDGPEGTAPGQIGRLNAAEHAELGRARAALEPNSKPNSPILNAFGNHIIHSIGKRKFLELRLVPQELPGLLPKDSDLDNDGIGDAQELAMGTHPMISSDGNPWLLFQANFKRYLPQIAITLLTTVSGLWGLAHLLRAFSITSNPEESATTED